MAEVMTEHVLEQYAMKPEGFDPLAEHPDEVRLLLNSIYEGTVLAGREKPFNWEIDSYTSEAALHRYRAEVEVEALINFVERGPVENIEVSPEDKEVLRSFYDPESFRPSDVKLMDNYGYKGMSKLEHDVKAVEVYLGLLMDEHGLGHLKNWLHFGMTSEDTNNLAYNLMLRDVMNEVVVPSVGRVADRLAYLAVTYADASTLGMTHAQPASPTTLGKQAGYQLELLAKTTAKLDGMRLSGKFSGAVGNRNPEKRLFPDFDFAAYSQDFVESMGFDYAPIQNQRNDHLSVSELLDNLKNTTIVGLDTIDQIWHKILDGQFGQELVKGEKGSSIMAHKINPWRIEDAQGLFEQAVALLHGATGGLVMSRHERDLSDHPWQHAYGDIFGRVVAGFNEMAVQLDRLFVNLPAVRKGLPQSYEVLSELIQTAGRVTGNTEAYDEAVEETQGKKLGRKEFLALADKSLPDGDIKDRVIATTPETYTGTAAELARDAVLRWDSIRNVVERGVLDESTSIDAVLFDLDGTLHLGDKEEVVARLSAISAELGSGFTEEEIIAFSRNSDFRDMRSFMVDAHNISFPDRQITELDFQSVNDSVSGSFDDKYYPAEHANLAMQVLKQSGKSLGLVTMRGNKSRDRILALHKFDGLLDVVIGRDDSNDRKKPHPQPAAMALERLGITDPRRALFVGDNQAEDIGAGNALHMKTALIGTTPPDPYGPVPTYHWPDLEPLVRRYGR